MFGALQSQLCIPQDARTLPPSSCSPIGIQTGIANRVAPFEIGTKWLFALDHV